MKNLVGVKQELLLSRIGDDEANRLVMALLTTARRIDAECVELLAEYEMSEGRLAALLGVSAEPGIAPGALADRLEVKSATVTGLLDGLERRDLVRRTSVVGDRRSISLQVTSAGEALLAALTPMYTDWLHHLSADIGAKDRAAATRAMATIQRNLDTDTSGG